MIGCSLVLQIPKALPSPFPHCRKPPHYITSVHKPFSGSKLHEKITNIIKKSEPSNHVKNFCLAIQLGTVLAAVEHPALAVTGVNDEEDLTWVLIQLAIVVFGYFIVMPPIIMNWLRIRWYKRKLFEMYLQFMFVFIFFPGVMLWAPFLNFRKFPRDPSMKYPWSTPENPTQVNNTFLKYPFASPEDYE